MRRSAAQSLACFACSRQRPPCRGARATGCQSRIPVFQAAWLPDSLSAGPPAATRQHQSAQGCVILGPIARGRGFWGLAECPHRQRRIFSAPFSAPHSQRIVTGGAGQMWRAVGLGRRSDPGLQRTEWGVRQGRGRRTASRPGLHGRKPQVPAVPAACPLGAAPFQYGRVPAARRLSSVSRQSLEIPARAQAAQRYRRRCCRALT